MRCIIYVQGKVFGIMAVTWAAGGFLAGAGVACAAGEAQGGHWPACAGQGLSMIRPADLAMPAK